MRHVKTILFVFVLTLLPAGAQENSLREAQQRLRLIATKAVANFRAAESIENQLRQDGNSLHPQWIAMRMRIEAALDDAQDELRTGKLKEANETLDRAQAWTDRF